MGRARFDQNNISSLIAVSNADGITPVELWADPATHGLLISASLSISGADGAITDGVSSSTRATVFNLTNSKPLATQIVDANGTAITSFGGGTQYTEDAAAAADPVGTVPILVRKDTPSATVSTDGDNIAQRATNFGAAYVQVVNSSGAYVDTFGGGTQYADGAAHGSSTGTLMMVDDGTLIQSAAGNASGELITQAKQNGTWNIGTLTSITNTVTISGTVTTTPPSNASTNVAQLNGTTTDTNSGAKSAGTLRVVLATDQPQLTNALKVDGSAVTQPVSLTSTTITGTVTVDSELTTADLDTGAGTDTRAVVGLVGSKSGGGVLIPGDATKGLAVDLTATGANATALKVDGSAVTQPISAASLPLPSTAATSTKQSDGTQKTQIVDGSGNVIGSTTNALDVNIKSGASSGTQYTEDAASAADPVGTMMMGVRRDTLSTTEVSADGDNIAIKATNKGAIHVKHADTLIVDGSGVTQPISGTVTTTPPSNASTNIAQINGVTPLMGNGITGTGSQRVTIASDNTPFAVKTDQTTHGTTDLVAADITKVAGAAISQGHGTAATAIRVELPTDGTGVVGLAAGSAVIGHVITDSGSVTAATLSAETTKVIGVTRTADGAGNLLTTNSTTYTAKFALDGNLLGTLGTAFSTAGKVDIKGADGDVFVRQTTAANLNMTAAQGGTWTVQPGNTPNTSPWLTTQTPAVSGGLSTFHLVSAASTNATNIKASAGQVFGWFVYNSNAAARKLVFHNTAGTPTAGASVFFAIVIPPSAGANVEFTNGIAFGTGIAITTVTDLTDAGATAVAASDLIINVFYK